jgi:hypothetical protein
VLHGELKYHVLPQAGGGIWCILNTKLMNWCLIAKWAWKILTDKGICVDIIRKKYLTRSNLVNMSSSGRYLFWEVMCKIVGLMRLGAKHSVNNSADTCFRLTTG